MMIAIRISKELDIPLVATNDIHYTYAEDAEAHDILLCIQTAKKVSDEDRMRYEGGQYYVKSELHIFNYIQFVIQLFHMLLFIIRIPFFQTIKTQLIYERVSMPDIDIDFCYERRQEVIDYVSRKYGADKVVQIVTFGTMAAKGVIRDVGRALDLPYNYASSKKQCSPPHCHARGLLECHFPAPS